jgi:hypothetical protein
MRQNRQETRAKPQQVPCAVTVTAPRERRSVTAPASKPRVSCCWGVTCTVVAGCYTHVARGLAPTDCIYPDCLIVTDFGRACEHSCPYERQQQKRAPPGVPAPNLHRRSMRSSRHVVRAADEKMLAAKHIDAGARYSCSGSSGSPSRDGEVALAGTYRRTAQRRTGHPLPSIESIELLAAERALPIFGTIEAEASSSSTSAAFAGAASMKVHGRLAHRQRSRSLW